MADLAVLFYSLPPEWQLEDINRLACRYITARRTDFTVIVFLKLIKLIIML